MISLTTLPLVTVAECDKEDTLCRVVLKATDNQWLASAADWLVAKPLAIAWIVLLGLGLRWLAVKLIGRALERASAVGDRRRQRAETMGSVLRSIASFVIFTIVLIMVLGELGFDIGPLIASAGLVGAALGFGAQSLVKDFLSGGFLFFEDQYGVGDRIVVGDTEGVVEALTLRITRMRADDGTTWYVRNGEILKVGNVSQGRRDGRGVPPGTEPAPG